jgi:hypothetical protein
VDSVVARPNLMADIKQQANQVLSECEAPSQGSFIQQIKEADPYPLNYVNRN